MTHQEIKSALKLFLKNQSDCYTRAIRLGNKPPPLKMLARCLNMKMPSVSTRRLERYLADGRSGNQLSIMVEDLFEFSKMAGMSLSEFVKKHLED